MFKTATGLVGLSTLVMCFAILLSTPTEAKRYRFMCQGDHLHYGSASGYRSRSAAMRSAIRDWAGFTEFEYGRKFSNWKIAKSKRTSCSKSTGSWHCSIQATPCRRNR